MRRPARPIAALLVPLLLAACATPGPLLTDGVTTIRAGVGMAREQTGVTFGAINKLAQDQAIDRKAARPEQTLKESDFPTPIAAADAAAWSEAFGILDAYGAALQRLVDPKRAEQTGDAIGALADSLNSPTINARIPPTLTGVFAALGAALVQARAEKSATAIMARTDPAFREVVSRMASAIGGSPAEANSLQFVVASSWNNGVLPGIENRYARMALADPARRMVLQDYVAAIAARDTQLASMSALQQSLIALGELHGAAARGRPGDAQFWIGRIGGWLDDVKRRAAVATQPGEQK